MTARGTFPSTPANRRPASADFCEIGKMDPDSARSLRRRGMMTHDAEDNMEKS